MKKRVKKMSRIEAAFAKCKLVDGILKLRQRKVNSTIEVARINLKYQKADEELKIEELIKNFAKGECEYSNNLDKLLERYDQLGRIDRTLETLDKIERYMNEEIEVEIKDDEDNE